MNAKFFEEQRRKMIAAIRTMADEVAAQIGKSALGERVLTAMAKVPRHEFVPIEVQQYAYLNRPIPIGFDKADLAALDGYGDDGSARAQA